MTKVSKVKDTITGKLFDPNKLPLQVLYKPNRGLLC